MNIKNELIIGIIGSIIIIVLTVFYVNQYQSQQDQFDKNSQNKIASQNVKPQQNLDTVLTVEEVAKHNSANDCWFIIENAAYDVTQYLSLHPGGKNRIIPFCGQDATVAYSTMGGKGSHSLFADNELSKLKIGQINENVNIEDISNQIQNNIELINSSGRNEREREDDD